MSEGQQRAPLEEQHPHSTPAEAEPAEAEPAEAEPAEAEHAEAEPAEAEPAEAEPAEGHKLHPLKPRQDLRQELLKERPLKRALRWTLSPLLFLLGLYACVALLMNSRYPSPIVDLVVGWRFSGELAWERASWGPEPWDVRLANPSVTDASGAQIVKARSLEVDDFWYLGLLSDHIGANGVTLRDAHVELKERAHLFKPRQLEWNIAEVFQPPHPTLDDGKPLPPITLDFAHLNVTNAEINVEMSVTKVQLKGVKVREGHFAFELQRKWMMMRADEASVGEALTQVWVRDLNALPPEDRVFLAHTAPVELSLTFPFKDVSVARYFWVGDLFGASKINARLHERDSLEARDALMTLVKGGTPELSGAVSAQVSDLTPYLAPWGLEETLRGEVSLKGELYGPVSDPCARQLSASGQLFLPALNSTRFSLTASKDREGDVQLSQLRTWSSLGDLELSGGLNLIELSGLFQLKLNALTWRDLAPLPLEWRPWGATTYGGATLKLRPHSEHMFEVGAELNSHLEGPAPLRLKARATLTGPHLSLHKLSASLGAARRPEVTLSARGHLNLEAHTFKLTLKSDAQLHPSLLPPLTLPLRGALSVSVSAEGPWASPQARGQLTGRGLRGQVEGLPWALTSLKAPFKLNTRALTLSGLELKGRDVSLGAELSLPFAHPERLKGWVALDQLALDLSPLKLPVKSRVKALFCDDEGGCQRYFKRAPLPKSLSPDACLSQLHARLNNTKEHTISKRAAGGFEGCVELKRLSYQSLTLNEVLASARWEPMAQRALLRRLRAWKGAHLLLDAEAQVDLKAQQLESSLKLNSLSLNLAQLFVPTPPPELKGLYGTLDAELSLGGAFSAPKGTGALTFRSVSFPLSALQLPNPIKVGLSELSFELNRSGVSFKGHLDKALWLNGDVPFSAPPYDIAELNLNLFEQRFSLFHAPVESEREARALLRRARAQGLAHESLSLLPLSLNDKQLTLFALGRESYCALSALKAPNASLSSLALQGRLEAQTALSEPSLPSVNLHLEGLKLDQWLRDPLGGLRRLTNDQEEPSSPALSPAQASPLAPQSSAPSERLSCAQRCQREGLCPTMTLRNERPLHVIVRSLKTAADAIYLNPQPHVKGQVSSGSSSPLARTVEGWRPRESVTLAPLTLSGPSQRLALSAALKEGQLTSALELKLGAVTLSPLLQDLFQQLEGELEAQLSAVGELSAPRVEGEVNIRELALLSPRAAIIGDIRQLSPMRLSLTALEDGGVVVSLPSREEVSLLRNEGDLTLNELDVQLPKFSFERLSVGFEARQLEARLPDLGRVSAQLQGMRFVMESAPDIPQMTLSGNVDLLRALYTADVIGSDEINQGVRNNFTGRSAVETLSVFERIPLLKRLKLDLNLKGEDDIIVRNQVGAVLKLDLDVMLDLNVKGYLYSLPDDPLDTQLRLSGEVQTLDGSTITYANNSFDVIDGRVQFGGALKGASQASSFMTAEVEATHVFRIPRQSLSNQQVSFDRTLGSDLVDEEVTLRAQLLMPTQASKPQIELDLSSQSGASKIEVATLVITGRYPNNLNAAASTQPATEVLLAPILNLIERPIEDSLGINLSLTPDTSGAGLFIDLNKSFSRRTRLYARTPIGEADEDSSRSFGLEYKLNNVLSGELTRQQVNLANATSGRLRLRLSWE